MGKKFQLTGASVILYKEGQILLQQRKDNLCWGYHGGAIELGEVVEEAAKRELYEETGLEAHDLDLYGVFSGPDLYNKYPDGNEAYIIDIVFICKTYGGEMRAQASEVVDLKWFDIGCLPEAISPPVKPVLDQFVRECLEGVHD